jgi:hypothetical protein
VPLNKCRQRSSAGPLQNGIKFRIASKTGEKIIPISLSKSADERIASFDVNVAIMVSMASV